MLFSFLVCFCFSVGSEVDVSNHIEWAISGTNTCPSFNKSKEPWISILLGYQQIRQAAPSEPMVSKYFKTYYFATYGSTVFYR
jgi:hypothetical protein